MMRVDPRDPAHLYFTMSGVGVHKSIDGGGNFAPLARGLEVVEDFEPANLAFHDPHCPRPRGCAVGDFGPGQGAALRRLPME